MSRRCVVLLAIAWLGCAPSPEERAQGLAAFATVRQVLQHPRCQNCHVPGDAPLQFDEGRAHQMGIVRGPDGRGAPGLPCATCHGSENLPASYGPHAPPGAPGWQLPKPERKMVFIDLSPAELCESVKDEEKTGKNLRQMLAHNAHDPLVGWGWDPGSGRTPVPIPRQQFVEAFRTWVEAGAPCPGRAVAPR